MHLEPLLGAVLGGGEPFGELIHVGGDMDGDGLEGGLGCIDCGGDAGFLSGSAECAGEGEEGGEVVVGGDDSGLRNANFLDELSGKGT